FLRPGRSLGDVPRLLATLAPLDEGVSRTASTRRGRLACLDGGGGGSGAVRGRAAGGRRAVRLGQRRVRRNRAGEGRDRARPEAAFRAAGPRPCRALRRRGGRDERATARGVARGGGS